MLGDRDQGPQGGGGEQAQTSQVYRGVPAYSIPTPKPDPPSGLLFNIINSFSCHVGNAPAPDGSGPLGHACLRLGL